MPDRPSSPPLALASSPPRFAFPDLPPPPPPPSSTHGGLPDFCCSELSSCTSTPFVSAPSSPSRMKGFHFSAPASPTQRLVSPFGPLRREERGTALSSCQCIHPWSLHVSPGEDDGDLLGSAHAEVHAIRISASPPQHGGNQWCVRALRNGGKDFVALSPQFGQKGCFSWASESGRMELEEESLQFLSTKRRGTAIWHEIDAQAPHFSEHRHRAPSQIGDLHGVTNGRGLGRLQAEESDLYYSVKSSCTSAVPFSWEKRPGTPKARSITSEGSGEEDDGSSRTLSGSSDFEFSARVVEFEEPPMSPTPISTAFKRFSFSRAIVHSPLHCPYVTLPQSQRQDVEDAQDQSGPLRPPPRLDHLVSPVKPLTKKNAGNHKQKRNHSTPQSPRSPRKFDIREVFCRFSRPELAVFDPFVAAIQKSMARESDALSKEARKTARKGTRGDAAHYRRTVSSSPLRIFHWDDHFSSFNGSSSMDDVKHKHPIQREIDARYNAQMQKGSKRWSFRGLLQRHSGGRGETVKDSNADVSVQSLGRESNLSSTNSKESCSSSATGEASMVIGSCGDDVNEIKAKDTCPSMSCNFDTMPQLVPIMPPASVLTSIDGGSFVDYHKRAYEAPYTVQYEIQQVHTEGVRKRSLPCKRGSLGCLKLSSRGCGAIAAASKLMQSVR